uniref:Tenascin-like n=1 Tax=Sinocyclocheilus grahami TaxID=75366 RepID=A0A672RKS4_SINGR
MGSGGLTFSCLVLATLMILNHADLTIPGIHNITLPTSSQPLVFNHVYNIKVPGSSLCSANLDSPAGSDLEQKDAPSSSEVTDHTLDSSNQIVFTHRINIPKQACGCTEGLPDLKELLNRLEMLEGEVSTLREQCATETTCCSAQATGTKPYCNGRGNYSTDTCGCICEPGWKGPNCTVPDCPRDCSDQGRCCVCQEGFEGPDCSVPTCPGNCNNRGRCLNGKCVCDKGFVGDACGERSCPNDCSGVGQCLDGRCVCDEGHIGEDCSEVSPPEDLTVTDVTTEKVNLTWKNEMLVTEYLVTYIPTSPGGLQLDFRVPGDRTSATVSELEPGIEYLINVYAVLNNKKSVPVSARVATCMFTCPDQPYTNTHTYLDPPRDLEVRDSTETTLELVWKRPRAKLSTYRLAFVSADGRREEVELPVTATTYTLSGLSPGMRYTITLVAERGRRRSAPATITTSTESFSISWNDTRGDIERFILEIIDSSWQREPVEYNLSQSTQSYEITGLRPTTDYIAYLTGVVKGRRTDSVSAVATTDVDSPRDLVASNIQTDSAVLTWTPPRAAITGYILTFQASDGDVRVRHFSHTTNVQMFLATHFCYWALSDLSSSTEHTVRLQAVAEDKRSTQISTVFSTVGMRYRNGKDCSEALMNGETSSGPYTIYISGDEKQPVRVYCDMSTDGGGWMVSPDELFTLATSDYYTYSCNIVSLCLSLGDSLSYHQNRPFSTYNNDNDIAVTNCALSYKGAFWYKNCHRVNLMGKYGDSSHSKGINWFHWKGHEHSIPFAEMKIRPVNFRNLEGRRKRS